MLQFCNLDNQVKELKMANAYTEMLKDEGATLEDFVLHGFVKQYINPEMRMPIPEKIQPSGYHKEELVRARERFAEIWEWDEAKADGEAEKDYQKEIKWYKKESVARKKLKKRYKKMLGKLKAWKPSNKQTEDLKSFLIECLERSLKGSDCYDIDEPVRKTGEEFKDVEIKKARHDMEYYGREQQEAIVFARLETKWINEIRESIREFTAIKVSK